MQLRRLEVTNIRSFDRGELDLGPGTTLLVGDVGAGKSSLLYAIEMALFGVAEVDAAFLVRHGTVHAEVAVTLADERGAYVVRRRFRKVRRRGRETFEPERLTFAEEGRPTAYSATEIRQRVIDLLGFPDNPNPHAHSDLWRWAIYVPQERMREILAANPEQRLETVRKALGVERYRTAAENAVLLSADLRLGARRRREEAARMAHWDTEFLEATREADRLRVERSALSATAARQESELESALERRRSADAAAAKLDADRRERERLVRDDADDAQALANYGRRRETLRSEVEAAAVEAGELRKVVADLPRLRSARASAEATLRGLRAEVDRGAESLRELARASAAWDAARRRSAEAADGLRRAEREREEARTAAEQSAREAPLKEPPSPTRRAVPELETELAARVQAEHLAVERLARVRARLDQIDQLLAAGVCPTCEQPVRPGDFHVHREQAAREVESAETSRSAEAQRRQAVEEELKARERYERAVERWKDADRRRAETREALGRRETDLATATAAASGAAREEEQALSHVEALRPAEADQARRRAEVVSAERAVQELAAAEQRAAAAELRLGLVEAVAGRVAAETSRLEADAATVVRRREERARQLARYEASLAETGAVARAQEEARAEERTLTNRVAEARAAVVRTDARLDALVERAATAERGRAERAALVAEAADLEAKADWVGEPFRIAVLRMEKEILAHAQTAFDRAFGRFFASLIDDPTLAARTDVSFTPEVTIAGQATPAEALSGGERTSLALAFRLALASVVRQLGSVRLETLLLDEPTDGFSTEQVVRMGELLEELALPQVVLVSHEGELAAVADRTVRVTKTGGRSRLEVDALPSSSSGEATPVADAGAASLTPARPARRRTR